SLLVALSNSNIVFCSVGTTRKKVKGDREAYRKIDFDIPAKLARFSKMAGCEKFILVSSVGATSKSNNFYLKLKGEVEDAVKTVGLRSLHIMRPSFLLGERKEFRIGEAIGKPLMQIFSFAIPAKYKAIHAKVVAKAMAAVAKSKNEGIFVYEHDQIKVLGNI
ncbi:MAG TPA: semialdehyde dehydrogenase, partial [Chitinophagaceae bacterium]|nr:semialdehyde dehydrogenase [Chitinophagaceae bacterium]